MELTLKQAYELSLEKWQWIVDHDGKHDNLPEKFEKLFADCGYCQYWLGQLKLNCTDCPLFIDGGFMNILTPNCCGSEHPYSIWYDNRTKETA